MYFSLTPLPRTNRLKPGVLLQYCICGQTPGRPVMWSPYYDNTHGLTRQKRLPFPEEENPHQRSSSRRVQTNSKLINLDTEHI